MAEKLVYRGRARTIEWAVMPNGTMPGHRGWLSLAPKQKAKLLDTITRLGDEGVVWTRERFRHERDGIYAIKAWKVRIYCFMTADQRIVLANTVSKKQDRARNKDLERADSIRKGCKNG